MPKPSKQVIIDAIIKEIEQGKKAEWIAEYLKEGDIYKITPPDCANRVNAFGYYVYALIDPFDGKIFYVGKGKGKRSRGHFLESNKSNPLKKAKINEIYDKGDKAIIWVLDHNMNEQCALDFEAVLINILPSLTNNVIPELREGNKWMENNSDLLGMVEAECIEVDPNTVRELGMEELKDLMAIVVCNGYRIEKDSHKYFLGRDYYDFSSVIHLLPARLRNVKAILFSEYIDKQVQYAKG